MNSRLLILTILAAAGLTMTADVISDARELISAGSLSEARDLLYDELEANPSGPNIGQVQELLGEIAMQQGDLDEARSYFEDAKKRGVADASRWLGRLALKDYNFASASTLYDQYVKLKNTAKKEVDPEAAAERRGIAKAKDALDRVERIQIIDSITVPKNDFYKHYRLSASSGHLLNPADAPDDDPDTKQHAAVAFLNERADKLMWAQPDSLGQKLIVESVRLTNGSWSPAEETSSILNGNGDADYPFMMSDGLTLYFANDGDDSMGGYDIFVASRDAIDGTWRSPQNLGMPFNSPFDDYMLAIDELTGVGWWVTDRKLLPDSLTLYVYIPNDVRVNIDTEEVDPLPYARIDDISMTQDPERDYSELLDAIAAIEPYEAKPDDEFSFRMPDGLLYTRFDRLPNDRVRTAMKDYLDAADTYADTYKRLDELRKDYHLNGSTAALKLQISDLETLVLKQKKKVRQLKNHLISLYLKS